MVAEMLDLCGACSQHITFAASAAHLFASAAEPRDAMLAHVYDTREVEAAAAAAETGQVERVSGTGEVGTASVNGGPRSVTLWGPAPKSVRRWLFALDATRTFVDIKPCSPLEELVIGFYAVVRPFYARFS
jgi:hypothetical protein